MNMKLKFNKHDVIVLIITFVIILTSLILLLSNKSSGNNVVVIRYNNEIVHKMNLSKDEIFTMDKDKYDLLLGDLTIEVKNGKVAVVEQTSNYNFCELMGANDRPGTAIICAPNGVVITIEGEKEDCSDWGPCGGE